MTLKAGLVRAQTCGDGLRYAARHRSMTGGAIGLRPGLAHSVLRMVEVREETAQAGEFLKRWVGLIERVRHVADRAHPYVGRCELRQMTIGAVLMLWKARLDRVVTTIVADGATPATRERRVRARIRVREFGIILREGAADAKERQEIRSREENQDA